MDDFSAVIGSVAFTGRQSEADEVGKAARPRFLTNPLEMRSDGGKRNSQMFCN